MTRPIHVDYNGEKYRLMSLGDAIDEFDRWKKQGLKPVIMSIGKGYIVAEAKFEKEGV